MRDLFQQVFAPSERNISRAYKLIEHTFFMQAAKFCNGFQIFKNRYFVEGSPKTCHYFPYHGSQERDGQASPNYPNPPCLTLQARRVG